MSSHLTSSSQTFLALTTWFMSSPSRKWEHGVGPRLHIIGFVFDVKQEKYEGGGVQDSRVTPVMEMFSLDRAAIRILLNINNIVPLLKQPTALTCWLFPQKGSTSNWTASADLTGGAVSVGCEWISTHGIPSHRPVQKEAVDVESNYKKSYFWWPGMGILLVVIWMGVTRSEKARVAYLLD